jgi:Transposase DDE domain group 1
MQGCSTIEVDRATQELRAGGRQIDAQPAETGPRRAEPLVDWHKIGHDRQAIEAAFVELYLDAHQRPPRQIILDLDATNDPLHGRQEERFFHGFYDCYCYLPLYVSCGRHPLAAKLRPAKIDASAGAVEEIRRIVGQLRARWPQLRILVRADAGFAQDGLMTWYELNGIDYLFGLARNTRLVGEIATQLAEARQQSRTGG